MNHADQEMLRVSPNPRVVALLDYAIDEISPKVSKPEYAEWLAWAAMWRAGRHSPQACVDISHFCSSHKGWGIDGNSTTPIWHTLGQLAWGAKEACYSAPTSGWMVIRYIADAMVTFGIAFPDRGVAALEPPTIDEQIKPEPKILRAFVPTDQIKAALSGGEHE